MTEQAGRTDAMEPTGADLTIGDYLGVLRRRSGLLCGVIAGVLLVGILIAYRLPPTYESTGILLAEQPEVPEHVVRSTVPYDPDDRVRIITQRVLTNDNLARIIAEQQLYAPLQPGSSEALEEFRANLGLAAEDPDILENLLGPSQAAESMAFSLSFSDHSPRIARDVTRSLVALYLEENQLARRRQAEDTTRFLTQEADRLAVEIGAREEQITAFKSKHIGSLPTDADRGLEDRALRDLELVDQEIRALRERRDESAAALSLLSPNATVLDETGQPILGPAERRALLERRYAQLSAIYGQDHPDVQKVLRELNGLRGSGVASSTSNQALTVELAAAEEQLEAARTRYAPDHPDVQRLQRTVANLRAAATNTSSGRAVYAIQPDNPQYLQRRSQLRMTESDLAAAIARREELNKRLLDLQRLATSAPEVERELAALTRGHEQLLTQYGDVQSKLREAQMSANLEMEGRGDRFTVLQAPQMPTSPAKPNRIAVLLLTLVIAFALGTGTVAFVERCDATIRHPRDVTERFGAPPLVAIPLVFNDDDLRRRSHRRLATVALAGLWVAVVAFLVMTPA